MDDREPNPRELPGAPLEPELIIDPSRRERISPDRRPRGTRLAAVLFVLTFFSMIYAIVSEPGGTVAGGLTYAVALMAILGAHEMGHYLQSRRYGIPATLPLFIPMPISPFGTMGAIILQQGGVADRRQLFDIAISGPLAGLVIAIPMTWWGLTQSRIEDVWLGSAIQYGDPLLIRWMAAEVLGPLRPGQKYLASPVLFAGWVGIFITALNLLPMGQLDGGHILYTLLLRRANGVSRTLFYAAVAFVVLGSVFIDVSYAGWTLMLILLSFMGPKHPPTADDHVPLGWTRIILGWLTLLFIVIGFTPMPIIESGPAPVRQEQPAASPSVHRPRG